MTKNDYSSIETAAHVKKIVNPLFEALQINYFAFIRVYENGGSISLTTHPQWARHYEQMQYYKYGVGLRHPQLYNSGFQLNDRCNLIRHYAPELFYDFKNFQLNHKFTLLRTFGSYMDRFCLATSPINYNINQHYLNNLDLITAFTWHFLDMAYPLIRQLENNKRVYPAHDQLFLTPDETWYHPSNEVHELIQFLKNRKLMFADGSAMITLTPRETTCLRLLVKNRGHKAIAKLLNSSPRTIETHIKNIKVKLCCRATCEIIDKILANESTRYFVYEFPFNHIL